MDKDITVKRLRSYDELLADERYYKQRLQASEARVAELEEIYEAALGLNALDMGECFEVNYQRMETLDRALEKYFETNRSINQRPVEVDKE